MRLDRPARVRSLHTRVLALTSAAALCGTMLAATSASGTPRTAPAGPLSSAAVATTTGARTSAKASSCDPDAGRFAARTDPGGFQTSDRVPGIPVGPPVEVPGATGRSAARAAGKAKNQVTYEIAPGITVQEWDQVDGRQPVGQARMNLITVDLDAPNISFDTLTGPALTARRKTSALGRRGGAIAAVNGDFFDICDTGAPLGVSVRKQDKLVSGPKVGWIPENMSLWFNAGEPRLGPLSVQWKLRQHPAWTIGGADTPRLRKGQIGVYTSHWGRTKGRSVTQGVRRTREVVVRGNRVIANRTKLSQGRRIRSNEKVLIGVGGAAGKLRTLRKGSKVTFVRKVHGGRPTVAITGDRPLLVDGLRRVVNDRLAHPRTAVGIDADGRKLLILVVDGRSSVSRGYTMVELANMMTTLGAENALNLDGGGSSAMWTRTLGGSMGIINEPSDGGERLVPNGFGVVYDGTLGPVVPVIPTPTETPTVTPTPTETPTVTPTEPPTR